MIAVERLSNESIYVGYQVLRECTYDISFPQTASGKSPTSGGLSRLSFLLFRSPVVTHCRRWVGTFEVSDHGGNDSCCVSHDRCYRRINKFRLGVDALRFHGYVDQSSVSLIGVQ